MAGAGAKVVRAKCEKCGSVKPAAFASSCDCHTFGLCAECGLALATENARHAIFTTAWTEFRHRRFCGMWFPKERR